MSFGKILKELRAEKGVTQVDVAKGCGLTTTCICSLEQETRNPTGSNVAALAEYFDVSADYLLGLEDDFGARVATPMHDTLTREEREILEKYRELNAPGKKLINTTMDTLLTSSARSGHNKITYED